MTLYNPLSLEQIHIRISEIVENDTAQIIYTSRANAAELTGLDKNTGNMIISEEKLDIPENIVESESRKSDLQEQVDTIIDQTGYMIDTMVGLENRDLYRICLCSSQYAGNREPQKYLHAKITGVSGRVRSDASYLAAIMFSFPLGDPPEHSCGICILRTVLPDVCRYDGDAGQPVSGA